MQKISLFIVVLTCSVFTYGQNQRAVDSLENLLLKLPLDTNRFNVLVELNNQFFNVDFGKCKSYMLKANFIAKKLNNKKEMAYANNELALVYNYSGNTDSALYFSRKSVRLYRQLNDEAMLAMAYNNLGYILYSTGKIDSCIHYYMKALKLKEKKGDHKALSTSYLNLGYIVSDNVSQVKGLNYYKKALYHAQKSDFTEMQATVCNNIGYTYSNYLKKPDSAMVYFKKAITFANETGNITIKARALNNMSVLLERRKEYESGLQLLFEALELNQKLGDRVSESIIHHRISAIYEKQNKIDQAKKHIAHAEKVMNQITNTDALSSMYFTAFKVYSKTGEYEKALNYYLKYDTLKDASNSINHTKIVGELEGKYQNEKKQLQIDNLNKAHELDREKIEKKNTLITSFIIGSILLLILMLAVYRGYKNKKKDNLIISAQKQVVEAQKLLVEEKNREILDSITYAKHLQEAILPPIHQINQFFPDSFILYQPKDIVAGDFYFFENLGDLVVFGAADCTGHGVPGAMVSVVCSNALKRAVKEFNLTVPGEILDKVRELVIETFEGKNGTVNDGMDISLCVYEPKTKTLMWAGANNPLWLIRNNGSEYEFTELKANKQPIGNYDEKLPFTTLKLQTQEGDMLYMFTDGYKDQFGGVVGGKGAKKFKADNFRKLLLTLAPFPMEEQCKQIHQQFVDWKGDYEQIDDVCVIGVRI